MISSFLSKEHKLATTFIIILGIALLCVTVLKSLSYDIEKLKLLLSSSYSIQEYIVSISKKIYKYGFMGFVEKYMLMEYIITTGVTFMFYLSVSHYYNKYNKLVKRVPSLNNFDYIGKRGNKLYLEPNNEETTIDVSVIEKDSENIETILNVNEIYITVEKNCVVINYRNGDENEGMITRGV